MFAAGQQARRVMVPDFRIGSCHSSLRRQYGVLYLALLFFLALMGLGLSSFGVIWSMDRQRAREAELIVAGIEMREAIRSYYEQSSGTAKRYPLALENLVTDDRFLQVRRHLRRIRPDPMTGKVDWRLIRTPDGGVMGVVSSSEKTALKTIPEVDGVQRVGPRYCDWRFVFLPGDPVPGFRTVR